MAKDKPKSPHRTFVNRPLNQLSTLKKNLKKQHQKKKKASLKAKPAEQTNPECENQEQQLFMAAMTGVKPLSAPHPIQSSKTSQKFQPSVSTLQQQQEEREVMQALRELIEGDAPLLIYETEETIEGAIEGLDHRILKKLRNGEFSVQDHLDLHGYTKDEARDLVEAFLLRAMSLGKRCVLIIHGRGHGSKDNIPVLKNALKNWLTKRALSKKVLAFTTARPYDGGAGAIYVLLRKSSQRHHR